VKKKRTNTKTASLLLLMRTTAPKRGDSLVTGSVILSSVFMGKRFKKGSIKYESIIMSGQSNKSSSSSNTNSGNSNTQSEPTVIQGWEHSTYANANSTYANDRYAYIGKDDDTREPMWMDNGPKGKK
jgi:hypothetical protein